MPSRGPLLVATVCVLFLSSFVSSGNASPDVLGLRVLLGINGIHGAEAQMQKMVQKYLTDRSLPDIRGSAHKSIMKVDYHLYNIKLHSFQFQQPLDIVLSESIQDVIVTLPKIYCSLDMDWSYETHPIPFHGSGSATDDLWFMVMAQLRLGHSTYGHLTLEMVQLEVRINDLDIHLHGGASWFYDIFVRIFHDKVESAFRNSIVSSIQDTFKEVDKTYIQGMKTEVIIADDIGYKFNLLPWGQNPYLRIYGGYSDHHSEFFYTKKEDKKCYPSNNYMLPDLRSLTDIQVLLSETTGTTLGCALWAGDKLQYTLNNKTAPKDFPIQFNTTVFQTVIPQLYKDYPNMPFEIYIKATEVPTTAINPEGVHIHIAGNVSTIVLPAQGAKVTAFTAYVDVHLLAKVLFLQERILAANVTTGEINVTLAQTNVGPISDSLLEFFGAIALSAGIPVINKYAVKGIPIPYLSSNNIKLSDTKLIYRESYLIINSRFSLA